ncbi:hypothetical protein ACFPK5_31875 [Streptomyces beijiangensis]|uniref:hypothetical protein n=1 Tax=Streptomyces beijiangensis TaxID=163361 RepID=UPI0033815737
MVICPTHYQLAIYRCELDLFSGGLQSEQTQAYHYQDVVAVRTDSVPLYQGGISVTPRPSQTSAGLPAGAGPGPCDAAGEEGRHLPVGPGPDLIGSDLI